MPSEWQVRAESSVSWRSKDALEHLHMNTNVPKPTDIPAGSVLVRIRAAAINARDMMVIAHDSIYPLDNTRDLTPCADGAGEVEAIGGGSVWKVGDRVMVYPFKVDWDGELPTFIELEGLGAGSIEGTLRQYAVFSDDQLIRAPTSLSFEQIATLPVAGGTAMNALFFGPKPLQKGMTVLTQGTGGVSCFAIQLAAAAGATVIATSSSDEKLEFTKRIGATHTINYVKTPEWNEKVLNLTNGKGVDIVVEVGGASTIEKSISSTKQGGLICSVGVLSESKGADLVRPLLFGGKILWGVLGFTKEHNIALAKMFEEHDIKPVIGRVFEFEDAVKAFDVSMDRSAVGKIVIRV